MEDVFLKMLQKKVAAQGSHFLSQSLLASDIQRAIGA